MTIKVNSMKTVHEKYIKTHGKQIKNEVLLYDEVELKITLKNEIFEKVSFANLWRLDLKQSTEFSSILSHEVTLIIEEGNIVLPVLHLFSVILCSESPLPTWLDLDPPKKHTSEHICEVFPERVDKWEKAILACSQHLPTRWGNLKFGRGRGTNWASITLLPDSDYNVTSRLVFTPSQFEPLFASPSLPWWTLHPLVSQNKSSFLKLLLLVPCHSNKQKG